MFSTFEESVMYHADDYGNLTLADAKRLFKEHGMDYYDARQDGMEATLKAHKLLDWLGYDSKAAENYWFELQAAG